MQHSSFFFTKMTSKANRKKQKKGYGTGTYRDQRGTTSECHSSQGDIAARTFPPGETGELVRSKQEKTYVPKHSSLTPYVTHRETQHTPAARRVRSKTNKLLQCGPTCSTGTETRVRMV